MRVTILTSSSDHPIYPLLLAWARDFRGADVEVVLNSAGARGGDFLFLISCTQLVKRDVRARYCHTLVIHCSDLPRGRGWSPQNWEVAAGAPELIATLLEADEPVDSGPIWAQEKIPLDGHELLDEINARWFAAEFRLMEKAISNGNDIVPRAQEARGATYYPRRTPENSRLDPDRSIAEQFDLIRACDNDRYPAFIDIRGHRYEVRLTKIGKSPS